jgi:hypothetical protein
VVSLDRAADPRLEIVLLSLGHPRAPIIIHVLHKHQFEVIADWKTLL